MLSHPQVMGNDNCEAVNGIKLARETKLLRKPPSATFPPQIPCNVTLDQIQAAVMRNQQLTT
jgi:hypothetical protein